MLTTAPDDAFKGFWVQSGLLPHEDKI